MLAQWDNICREFTLITLLGCDGCLVRPVRTTGERRLLDESVNVFLEPDFILLMIARDDDLARSKIDVKVARRGFMAGANTGFGSERIATSQIRLTATRIMTKIHTQLRVRP